MALYYYTEILNWLKGVVIFCSSGIFTQALLPYPPLHANLRSLFKSRACLYIIRLLHIQLQNACHLHVVPLQRSRT